MLKRVVVISLMLSFYVLFSGALVLSAENISSERPEFQFLILLDVSKSMPENDLNKYVKTQAADFIDRIDDRLFPVRFSIIPFAGECPAKEILDDNWVVFSSKADLKITDVENRIVEYDEYFSYTDIGKALEKCNDILKDMKKESPNCKQYVLFITDGIIDVEGTCCTRPDGFDNIEASYNKVIEAAKLFPDEADFFAIIPDENMRNSFLGLSNKNNVPNKYYNYSSIPEGKVTKVRDYINCIEEFIRILNSRPQKNIIDHPLEVNWHGEESQTKIREYYKEIITKICGTYFSDYPEKAVNADSFDLNIPPFINEVMLSIWPLDGSASQSESNLNELDTTNDFSVFLDNSKYDDVLIRKRDDKVLIDLIRPKDGYYTIKIPENIMTVDIELAINANIDLVPKNNIVIVPIGKDAAVPCDFIGANNLVVPPEYDNSLSVLVDEVMIDADASNNDFSFMYNDGNWQLCFHPEVFGRYDLKLSIVYEDKSSDKTVLNSSFISKDEISFICIPTEVYIVPQVCVAEKANMLVDDEDGTYHIIDILLSFITANMSVILIVIAIIVGLIIVYAVIMSHRSKKVKVTIVFSDGAKENIHLKPGDELTVKGISVRNISGQISYSEKPSKSYKNVNGCLIDLRKS